MSTARANELIPRREVDPRQDLPALERQVLARWSERDVFAKSLRARESAPRWVFYEGPPTANGPPGSHHVLSRVFKDIYPRFKTMCGYRVDRKGGWDCHGLPVEIAVEQDLGITSKAEIESYGIKQFNERCRESVFAYVAEWDRLTERIGFWIDLDHAYRTLDESYIESVWWALAEIHANGLLYEGNKVVPYCPRCETTLSSHEVALGYRDVTDPSVFLKLPVAAGEDRLLVWTTTPWTLPGNVAVAVSPSATYARVRVGAEVFVLAEARVSDVLGERAKVLERFSGEQLRERYRTYRGPIFAASDRPAVEELPILADVFVTTEDGTGIVHMAPAFGEDDYRVAGAAPEVSFDPTKPHTLYNPVRADGTFDDRVRAADGRSWEGRFVKDEELTRELVDDLRERGLLLKVTAYEHSYPHCWRCGTPLLYYAKPSWYIATSRLRERLLATNETINWYPDNVKHGRFGDWLANNVDWALSRERYWGTPLPVWRCEQGHTWVAGSFAELARRSGRELDDHHRPFVDELELRCEHGVDGAACERPMRRVPEVIDVWFDSGAMPFAQHHFPFEHEQQFAEHFPADFICEAQDQTRGWFYSLLAESVLLGREAPYRNVVCLGLILDEEGLKMSKSRGNTVEPWSVLDSFGADAFRWYFFTAKAPWDGYRFSAEAIGEGVRLFLKQLWSTYFFYVLYSRAAANELQGARDAAPAVDALDRWALSRTAATAELVYERLDDYDATSAGRAIAALVEELSNWYVRRSRRRFWEGDATAFATLRTCLLTTAKLLAPLCPFIADEIYDNLDGELESVHLCEFPARPGAGLHDGANALARDPELEVAMALARETVRLGLGARGKAKIKVRQPLGEAVVVAAGREREAIESLADTVREELNVRSVRFVAAADELGSYEVKANYRTLGPLFGKDMPMAASAIAALDGAHVAAMLRGPGAPEDGDGASAHAVAAEHGGTGEPRLGITVAGREHVLSPDDVILTLRAPEGYSVEREGSHAVALDLAIDESLRREGYARELVHAVQSARRNAGLAVEDRIELALAGDDELVAAAQEHRGYIAGETLALELALGDDSSLTAEHRETVKLDGRSLTIDLRRAPARG
ncbi:MAG TPA: isoleucine--tRNA ligase [Solirubrobacteraceae bacterium]|nr:isoleucine--tRNA ligase [Solirubrobacteraceae bacterium]